MKAMKLPRDGQRPNRRHLVKKSNPVRIEPDRIRHRRCIVEHRSGQQVQTEGHENAMTEKRFVGGFSYGSSLDGRALGAGTVGSPMR
jgi:hypothetical protein